MLTQPMYAEVLLPVPIRGTFTYEVPAQMQGVISQGHRVIVPFGLRKSYTGIVQGFSLRRPEGFDVKKIELLLDDGPIVRHPQMRFWQWLADYYLCTPGEVYRAAVPSGLKLESETFVSPVKGWEEDPDDRLSQEEKSVLEGLYESGEARIQLGKLGRITMADTLGPTINRLLRRGAVMISENLVERYHGRKETFVRLTAPRGDSDALHAAFDAVRKGSRQETALLTLIEMSGFMKQSVPDPIEVSRADLMDRSGVTSEVINALTKKGIIEKYVKEVSRFASKGPGTGILPELSEAQSKALAEVRRSWNEKAVTLLHGVTSSGKTELYIHLIDEVLRLKRQVLYLVPEIALTTQLTSRLQRVFGERVVIYHSKFSDNERVEIWNRLLHTSEPCVVIGARSAVFLPFASLGLVIVDEEHETSYKQQDPAPRYNGRDAAIVLAAMHGAKTLLGSATPSVETYRKAETGRFGLVSLTERYAGAQMPEMELIDMTEARRKGEVKGIFALATKNMVQDAVEQGEQAIIFLNRRGYAPVARCKMCGYVPRCRHCDVSLTYHRRWDSLVCHYCGTPYPVPEVCPACKEPGIEVLGYGTERIEEEVAEAFPGVEMARMDLDTTRNKDGYDRIIDNFSQGKSRILVGTQMVTKGLDFGNVSTVCVANADSTINFPDFRSTERAFNMIEQVAGRAGRKTANGKVAIQTYSPAHPVFPYILAHDYLGYYRHELAEREKYLYPPFVRIIYIYIKHKERERLETMANSMAARLRELLGTRVQGPEEPMVSRVQNLYIRRIMLKIENDASISKVKQLLADVRTEMTNNKQLTGAIVYQDVDPV